MKKYIHILALIFVICSFSNSYSCTAFVVHKNGGIFLGRNFDWITGYGLIMTNPRNVEKTALVDGSERAFKWTSKFGSVTFNQVGRDLPYGGINESGLVVEHMSLEETRYPVKDNRYAIGACQWIQFQLDNYSTIEEVIKSDTLLRIVDGVSKFHYLITDRFGHSATIEFLEGQMVFHTGESLPVEALANSPYELSLSCYKKNEDTISNRSLYNFCTAASSQETDSSSVNSPIEEAFNTLKAVSQGVFTKWSIVYDVTNMKIYFKVFETPLIVGEQKIFTRRPGEADIKVLDVMSLSFDCNDSPKVLDLNSDYTGALNSYLTNYSTIVNKEIIVKTFTFFKGWGINIILSEDEIDYLARFPESFRCADK